MTLLDMILKAWILFEVPIKRIVSCINLTCCIEFSSMLMFQTNVFKTWQNKKWCLFTGFVVTCVVFNYYVCTNIGVVINMICYFIAVKDSFLNGICFSKLSTVLHLFLLVMSINFDFALFWKIIKLDMYFVMCFYSFFLLVITYS